MQHAGGLCRKPHVSTSLDQYQFYKFLRGLSSRPERPAAHPRGPLRPPASLEPRSPACHALLRPAAPTSHVGSTCPTSQSLDRTLNKLALRHLPPSSSRRGSSCRPADQFLSIVRDYRLTYLRSQRTLNIKIRRLKSAAGMKLAASVSDGHGRASHTLSFWSGSPEKFFGLIPEEKCNFRPRPRDVVIYFFHGARSARKCID